VEEIKMKKFVIGLVILLLFTISIATAGVPVQKMSKDDFQSKMQTIQAKYYGIEMPVPTVMMPVPTETVTQLEVSFSPSSKWLVKMPDAVTSYDWSYTHGPITITSFFIRVK